MKKIYSLLVAILVTSFSFGQIWTEDFNSYTDGTGVEGPGGTTPVNIGDYPGSVTKWTLDPSGADLSANSDYAKTVSGVLTFQDIDGTGMIWTSESIDISGAASPVTLQLEASNNNGGFEALDFINVEYSINGGGYTLIQDWNGLGDATHTILGEKGGVDWSTVETIQATGLSGNSLQIRVTVLNNAGGEQIMFDNVSVFEGAAPPSINITSPAESSTVPTGDVDIVFTVNNFTVATAGMGDGHIHYTVDGGGDVMKFDTADINLTGLAPGAHTVVMRLVDDSHADIIPAVSATVNFTVATYTPVANIAALRAGTNNNYYQLTGEALLTYQQSFRNQKFIEDATGAILIDDNSGTIITSYNRADGITGIRGQLTEFNGMKQFVPTVDPGAASSTGNTLTPQIVTLATLNANSEDYESELVTIQGTTMDNTTPTFNTGTVYQLTQGVDNYDFRTTFFSADYMGAEVPTTTFDLTGIITERAGNAYYVTARDINDFSVVLSIANNTIEGFKIYPNPSATGFVNIITSNNLPKTIEIFDLLGKKVISEKEVTSQVNISHLQTGIYVVKVTENNKSATKRLVVR